MLDSDIIAIETLLLHYSSTVALLFVSQVHR